MSALAAALLWDAAVWLAVVELAPLLLELLPQTANASEQLAPRPGT